MAVSFQKGAAETGAPFQSSMDMQKVSKSSKSFTITYHNLKSSVRKLFSAVDQLSSDLIGWM